MESDEKFNYININKFNYILKKIEIILFKVFLFIYFFLRIGFTKNNKYSLKDFNKNILDKKESFPILNNTGYFKITSIQYSFSFKYNIVKVDYDIGFFDKDNNIILPSDISLYKNLSIVCNILLKNGSNINSLANIYKNNFYNCIEFCLMNETIKFGVKIYENMKHSYFHLFSEEIFFYNNLNKHLGDMFDPLLIIDEYYSIIKKVDNKKDLNKKLQLKKSFLQFPYFILKRDTQLNENKWFFKNLYNYYFCFCKGNSCLDKNINENCKYYFYLYIIDNNKQVYQKTEYLFIDFIFADLSSDDVYPIFQKMIKQNLPVHYITEKTDIYNKYCKNIKNCLIILQVKKEKNPINSNFLEKYLTLFLKIKVVVSGRGTTFNTNLFFDIEYITYICVGHGVCYFKDYDISKIIYIITIEYMELRKIIKYYYHLLKKLFL